MQREGLFPESAWSGGASIYATEGEASWCNTDGANCTELIEKEERKSQLAATTCKHKGREI